MTNFVNKNFDYNGEYLFYRVPGEEIKRFVARFKYGGVVAFKKFLRENFTVEEYFDLLENEGLAPLKVLETKGYVSPNVAKILKMRGYPMTLEGRNKMIAADMMKQAAQMESQIAGLQAEVARLTEEATALDPSVAPAPAPKKRGRPKKAAA